MYCYVLPNKLAKLDFFQENNKHAALLLGRSEYLRKLALSSERYTKYLLTY